MPGSTRPIPTPPERRRRLTRKRPWYVALSHTSDLARYPTRRSFVEAAKAAVARAHHGLQDMGLWSARPSPPHLYCVDMVEQSDIYVGLIGMRYGTVVPTRPDLSYTQLEFETATNLGLPRLVFLIDSQGPVPQPPEHLRRQEEFRRRLQEEAGVVIARVVTTEALELGLYQSLVELNDELKKG